MKRLSNGRRGSDLPMRVRRRQSDAKWRANVASCYETLKLIIPMNKRASKRQISKALILQETSKHINFLEHILETLLLEKGHLAGKDDLEPWVMDRIRMVKNEFVETQKEKIAALNMERRYKRSRYKLMIADHLLPPGNHGNVPASSGTTPCSSNPRGKGKVPEQNWGAESQQEGNEADRDESPLGHLAQVVPEGQLPLLGNEAPGSYEASYRKYLEQQSKNTASTAEGAAMANDGDGKVVLNLQLVPEATTRGTHMYKVTTRQREKTPASGKRPVNLKLSASQRLPSAGGNQSVNMQRESVNRHCADTAAKQEVAMSRAKRVLDMGDGNSGTRKKRTSKRSSASADTSLQPDFTPVKSKQASTVTSFTPVKLPFMSWLLTPTSPSTSWTSTGNQMVPVSPTVDFQPGDANTDTQSLLCTEPMWLSSDEDCPEEDEEIDLCKMNEKTPVSSRSRHSRGKQSKKRKQTPSLDPDFELGCGQQKVSVGQPLREQLQRSSKHRKMDGRRRPRCMRSLELSFPSTDCELLSGLMDSEDLSTQVPQLIMPLNLDDCNPTDSENIRSPGIFSTNQIDTKDFDGYLLFYQQKLQQMEQSVGSADIHSDEVSLSEAVYESWCDLTDDQRQTMITLAITENASRHSDDSCLSDDLLMVNIQPMCKLEKGLVDVDLDISGKKALELAAPSEFWPLAYDTDLQKSGHSDIVPISSGKSPSPLLSAGSSHIDQDVPSMPFSALTSDCDDDIPSQVCPTGDHSQPVSETMTGKDDDMASVKPLLVLTDKMVVSSLWCATDEPLESFEYIGQFSPLLGHKLELFQ